MIVTLESPEELRATRIKLYKDDVFLIAQEAINKLQLSLNIVELFASADQFANFLLENDLSDRDVLHYEVDDLKAEVSDELTSHILLAVTYIKLCALSKVKPNAESIARALVGFCQEYDGFADFLKQLYKKEHGKIWINNKRINRLNYELRCIEKDTPNVDAHAIVTAIVDSASVGLSSDMMVPVENTLAEVNDKFGHQFQKQLDQLREARKKKSRAHIKVDKINDIHDNEKVTIEGK